MIYVDNAATTKLDAEAFEVMQQYFIEEYANPSQSYSFSRNSKTALRNARETIAYCINAEPEEIYFTSGGTESDNWALKGFSKSQNNKKRIMISSIEHHAVIHTAEALKREGYDIEILEVSKEGVVLPSFLESRISSDTAIVSVMSANNEIGSIQPISDLVKISHSYGAFFHTDAVQAVGHIEIDVKELDVDMLSASAHKFNGPKGIGFLYIKRGTPIYPLIDGGSQENNLRAGTENVAGIVGMAIALKNNCKAIAENKKYLEHLEEELINGLKNRNIRFIRNGAAEHIPGNVSMSFYESNGEMLLHRLDLMRISVSTGSACDSQNSRISHVIKAIGVPEKYANGTIRISFGKDNTMEEVSCIIEALTKILS